MSFHGLLQLLRHPRAKSYYLGAVFVVFALIVWIYYVPDERRAVRRTQVAEAKPPLDIANDAEWIRRSTLGLANVQVLQEEKKTDEERIHAQEQAIQKQAQMIQELNDRVEKMSSQDKPVDTQTVLAIAKPMIDQAIAADRMQRQQVDMSKMMNNAEAKPSRQIITPDISELAPTADIDVKSEQVKILAGSFVGVKSFNGIAALADGEKVHTVLRLGDIQTANNGYVPSHDCRIVAESEIEVRNDILARAMFDGRQLSCVLDDGRAMSWPIGGYVTDIDNTTGFGAKVVRLGFEQMKELSKAIATGAIAKLAKAGEDSTKQVSIFGNVTEVGSDVLGDLATQIGEIFIDAAKSYAYPIILVDANKSGYFYFTEDVVLEGITPSDLTVARGFSHADFN